MLVPALEFTPSLGVSKQPHNPVPPVGLGMPKATMDCPSDNHRVCSLMGK